MAAATPWGGLSPEGGEDTDASTSCRPWREARERLLDTAGGLFYARGIRAVGVDTIIAASGVAKATFYKHFPPRRTWSSRTWTASTRDGRPSSARRRRLQARTRGNGWSASSTPCPRHRSARATAAAGSSTRRPESTPGSPVHARAVAHKRAVRDWVEELAHEAGADDPRGLACS
jgi:hypothetical protein